MKVVITGATGLIGASLTRALTERGDHVVALSRSQASAMRKLGHEVEIQIWRDPKLSPPPTGALAGADAVVNLLGEPVAQRWSAGAKQEIRDSRVLSTHSLVAGMRSLPAETRPSTLISQSATGYYGPRGDEPVGEDASAGEDFLAKVTREWEQEALAARELPGMRVVISRTGVVLSTDGGALAKMLTPFRLGVGGPVGGGKQYVPWIHPDDVASALLRCLDDHRLAGPVNITAPEPVTNAELSKTLGAVLNRPAVLPIPAAALKLLYGEMASIVLTGQRVIPERLLAIGHRFAYPELRPALEEVLECA